mgnify:FL=1
MLTCKFCGDERKNHNSFINHQRTCPQNPDRKGWISGKLGKKGGNIFTKARELGTEIPPGNTNRGMLGKKHNNITKAKISGTRKKMFSDGKLSGKNRVRYYEAHLEMETVFYLAIFTSETDKFLKIGITETGFADRYCRSSYSIYEKEVLYEEKMNAFQAALLEKRLLKKFRPIFKYRRIENFNGKSECLQLEALDQILSELGPTAGGKSATKTEPPSSLVLSSLASHTARLRPRSRTRVVSTHTSCPAC